MSCHNSKKLTGLMGGFRNLAAQDGLNPYQGSAHAVCASLSLEESLECLPL